MNKRVCYAILETEYDNGYIPCIVTENEPGFNKTDWNWGTDLELARKIANEKNKKMGITEKDMWDILTSSMRASNHFNRDIKE
jgi:hypothetical protein